MVGVHKQLTPHKCGLIVDKCKQTCLQSGPALAKQCWMGIQGITVGCEHSVRSTLN